MDVNSQFMLNVMAYVITILDLGIPFFNFEGVPNNSSCEITKQVNSL